MIKTIYLSFLCMLGTLIIQAQTIEIALSQSGLNKKSLTTVLEHYTKTGEKQKYNAAVFLIENMPIHKSINYRWIGEKGNDVLFSELEYANSTEAFDVLEQLKDSLNLKSLVYEIKDTDVITSERLIKNIDLSFFEWKNNPWSSTYSFRTFCEYILPYRSLIEPMTPWRKEYKQLVSGGVKNAMDVNDPVDVGTHILLELSDISFTNKIVDPIPLLSPQHLLFRKKGSCPDLANLSLFACRSIGLAVTFDFTPNYAASSNRHFWNTLIDAKGQHIAFNGNTYGTKSGLPTLYNPNEKRLGKVFRRTFSIQSDALSTHKMLNEIPNCFLQDKNIKDVTNEYVDVGMIMYKFNSKYAIMDIAFLNVFNKGKWRLIDFGKKERDVFIFKNIGTNLVYLPSQYINQKMFFGQYPLLLDEFQKTHVLKPDFNNSFNVTLSRTNEIKNKYKDYNPQEIEEGKDYLLLYWNSKWKKIGISRATKEGVSFKGVPKNALFRLLPRNLDGFERVFMIDDKTKSIKWY